jgi:hypothetical protein
MAVGLDVVFVIVNFIIVVVIGVVVQLVVVIVVLVAIKFLLVVIIVFVIVFWNMVCFNRDDNFVLVEESVPLVTSLLRSRGDLVVLVIDYSLVHCSSKLLVAGPAELRFFAGVIGDRHQFVVVIRRGRIALAVIFTVVFTVVKGSVSHSSVSASESSISSWPPKRSPGGVDSELLGLLGLVMEHQGLVS